MKQNNILILGADGMLGQTVFQYLNQSKLKTYGTTHKNSSGFFTLSVEKFQTDVLRILKELHEINYIINCIGVTNENSDKLALVNSIFPHALEEFGEANKTKIIHISTDAVFSKNSLECNELTLPNPDTNYGKSKLEGETKSRYAMTIRTSLLGLDSINHRGFLERILQTEGEFISYDNQIWTGCTTLQFAEFCEWVFQGNMFESLREQSPIFHFVPLGQLSKYEVAIRFNEIFNLGKEIKKERGVKITRKLNTLFFDLLQLSKYNYGIDSAFERMKEFISHERNRP